MTAFYCSAGKNSLYSAKFSRGHKIYQNLLGVCVTKLNASIRTQLYKILFWQLTIIMGLVIVIGLLQGLQRGWSALVGGLAYWVPTVVFLWRVTVHAGARAAMRFMVAFFTGEVVKLFLSGVFFVIAVKYLSVDVLYGFIGLIGAIIAFWVVSVSSLLSGGRA
jgi:ATP synthase protein I